MPGFARLILLWVIFAITAFVIAAWVSVSRATPNIQLTLSGIQRLHWASVTCSDAAATNGFAIAIDGNPTLTTNNGASATYFWNTANLSGSHTAACTTSTGSASKIIVFGSTPLPTFSPSPTPTVLPTSTPTPTPTPVPTPSPITGVTYYVDFAAGNDANNGTAIGTPWLTVAKVKSHGLLPGDAALFKAGTTTNEMLDLAGFQGQAGKPIVFSSYGAGAQPIFDELGAHNFCMFGDPIYGGSTQVKYVTIDNIHCIHAIKSGIKFDVGSGTSFPGIIVQRSTIEDNGQGCSGVTGACLGTDDGGYNNCLDFQDSNFVNTGSDPDGVQFLNNTVRWCGGHNLVQVHYDTGAVIIRGNTVGPGGVHGYIDCKGCGSNAVPALIESNTVIGGGATGFQGPGTSLYYTEDPFGARENIIYRYNVGYDTKYAGFQFCPGGCTHGTCGMTGSFWNNTIYVTPAFAATATAMYANASCNGPAFSVAPSLDVRNDIFDGGDMEWAGGMGCTEHNNSIGGSQGHGPLTICGGSATGSNDQININPTFTNAGTGDFTLQVGSPAINAGQIGLTGNANIGAK